MRHNTASNILTIFAILFVSNTLLSSQPLYEAIKEGDLNRVQQLVGENKDLITPDVLSVEGSYDHSPLCVAIENFKFQIAEFLIHNGASFKECNGEGYDDDRCYPLHMAAQTKGALFVIKAMLGKAPDLCALYGDSDIMGFHDTPNTSPLHRAAGAGLYSIVKLLKDKGCSVRCMDSCGRIPLHSAAQSGHVVVGEYLIEHGSPVNKADKEGDTPLHYAARKGHLNTVYALRTRGADLNRENDKRSTPLHEATKYGRFEVVSYLLAWDVCDTIRDNQGLTALEYARRANKAEICRLFEEKLS